jgi:hypothetical protein
MHDSKESDKLQTIDSVDNVILFICPAFFFLKKKKNSGFESGGRGGSGLFFSECSETKSSKCVRGGVMEVRGRQFGSVDLCRLPSVVCSFRVPWTDRPFLLAGSCCRCRAKENEPSDVT